MPSRSALQDESLALALQRLQRLLSSRRVQSSWATAAGVPLPQQAIQVLRTLGDEPPRPVADVARAARMDVGAVSRQLRKLAEAGLARREASPHNGSVVLVEATPAGVDLARRYEDVGDRQLADALAGWSDHDRERLGQLLLRFVDDLQRTPYRNDG